MIAILIRLIGPYHHARLCAAAQRIAEAAVEIFSADDSYAWDQVDWDGPYERIDMLREAELVSEPARIGHRIWRVLDRLKPEAVAIPGWHEGAGLALAW